MYVLDRPGTCRAFEKEKAVSPGVWSVLAFRPHTAQPDETTLMQLWYLGMQLTPGP